MGRVPDGQNEMSVEMQLAAVRDALDWAHAPTSDEHIDAMDRICGEQPRGYALAGRVRALYSRERIASNRQRARAEKAEALIRPGDQLQSSASRLAEFVRALDQAPHEVQMAALEAQSAVDEWTEIRRKS